ncbi:MAG: hypothetical protein R6V72_11435 [Cyclobacterium sp.]
MMKSSMSLATHGEMTINHARFSRLRIGTGYVAIKEQIIDT